MNRFDWCVDQVLDAEGGAAITNDQDDPGGLTRWGISKRAYPDLDIESLTREEAVAIYRRDYWDAVHAGELPAPLDHYVFDCAVNQGTQRAAHFLQLVLRVPIDGVIGPLTLKVARTSNIAEISALFMAQRAMHYATLATFPKYGRGWMKRLFLVAATRPPHQGDPA
jgi:lysozyme family protein